MTDGVVVKRLGEFETLGRGVFHRIGAGLGVTSFGINVERWPPGSTDYPDHDESQSGQEEVYVPLEGCAFLLVGEHEYELAPGTFARVPAGTRRKIVTRDDSVTLLCIGAVPGRPFTPSGPAHRQDLPG